MLYNKDWEKTDTTITPSLLLNQCADHLEQYGWCQNAIGKRFAPMCSIGVLFAVGGSLPENRNLVGHAGAALEKHLGFDRRLDLVTWNNAPGRTKEQVIAAFRGAAKDATV